MYEDFQVTYRNGVVRTFHETSADVRTTAAFYAPTDGPIVKVTRVKAPKVN